MIITISGVAGSGKSTVAKELAVRLGFKHFSMGDIQREIAKDKGLTIVELGELEKKDRSIDMEIDDRQARLGQEKDNFVIDSWLASKFIPHAFKVFLDCDLDVRAKRICKKREAEGYNDVNLAKKAIVQRERTNRERWIEYYGYDFLDMQNYDVVLDTTRMTPKTCVNKIILAKDKLYKASSNP
jgi:predicted cytidylate kinase